MYALSDRFRWKKAITKSFRKILFGKNFRNFQKVESRRVSPFTEKPKHPKNAKLAVSADLETDSTNIYKCVFCMEGGFMRHKKKIQKTKNV